MNRYAIVGVAAAVALCGCGRERANQQAASGNANETGGTPVTLVGCLVPGGAGAPTGAVGTSGNTAVPGFTLIDTTTTASAASDTGAASGVSGTTGQPSAASSATPSVETGTPRSYSLLGGKDNDLQRYTNSRVEVTGRLVASTDTGAGVPDVGAATAPAGTPPTDVQRVRVDHVRQLAASCTDTKR